MTAVTQKGQATIPANIRTYLGLTPGDQVEFVVIDGEVVLRKASGSQAFDRGRHLFGKWSSGDSETSSRAARKAIVAEALSDKHG